MVNASTVSGTSSELTIGICDIYPQTGQQICLDGGGKGVGENCDVGRQCTVRSDSLWALIDH